MPSQGGKHCVQLRAKLGIVEGELAGIQSREMLKDLVAEEYASWEKKADLIYIGRRQ
jgi:hypothetical protein